MGQYVEPVFAMRLIEDHPEHSVSRLVGNRRRHGPLADLTPREPEVLSTIAEGLSNLSHRPRDGGARERDRCGT